MRRRTRGRRSSGRPRNATRYSSISRPSSIADLVRQQARSPHKLTGSARIKHGLQSFIAYLFLYTGSLGILPMLFIAPSVGYLMLGWAGLDCYCCLYVVHVSIQEISRKFFPIRIGLLILFVRQARVSLMKRFIEKAT